MTIENERIFVIGKEQGFKPNPKVRPFKPR